MRWFISPVILTVLWCGSLSAQETTPGSSNETTASPSAAASSVEPVLLRHRYEEGEVMRWKIEHEATTLTQIQGNVQESSSRSVSTRKWTVSDVDDQGRITFTQSVDDVRMNSKVEGRPEVRYDSRERVPPPPEYSGVAETIGVPLATYSVEPWGEVVERVSELPPQDLGLGDIVIPLPKEPVAPGATWDSPGELSARESDGQRVRIKTRQRYFFIEVKNGVAYLKVETQVLTPNISPRVRSQIMQQMTFGTILFDIEQGRVWSQTIDWDEQVIGFDSPSSLMKYNARYTQKLLADGVTSAQSANTAETPYLASPHTTPRAVRLSDEQPVLRR